MSLPKLAKQFRNVALAAMWFALAAVAAGAVLQGVTMVGVVTGASAAHDCELFNVSDPAESYAFLHGTLDDVSDVVISNIYASVDPADSSESLDVLIFQCTMGTNCDSAVVEANKATYGIDAGTAVTADNNGAQDDGTLSNATVSAGDRIGFHIIDGSVTGTISMLDVTVCFDRQ